MFRPSQDHYQANLQKFNLSSWIVFLIWIQLVTIYFILIANTTFFKYNLINTHKKHSNNIRFFKLNFCFNDKIALITILILHPNYEVLSKVPEIWILHTNGYEHIEIQLGVSPHTLLESVWQAASRWVVRFIVGGRISIVVLPWLEVLRWMAWKSSVSVYIFILNLGKPLQKRMECWSKLLVITV
jgi:hypothetical protein